MDGISPNLDVFSAIQLLLPDKPDQWTKERAAQLNGFDIETVGDIQGINDAIWNGLAIDPELKNKLAVFRGTSLNRSDTPSPEDLPPPPAEEVVTIAATKHASSVPPPSHSPSPPPPPQSASFSSSPSSAKLETLSDDKELWKGYLQKQGAGLLGGGFVRRFVVIHHQKLQYYNDDGSVLLGDIPLKTDTKIVATSTKTQPFGIELTPTSGFRTYRLAARDATERNQVMNILAIACKDQLPQSALNPAVLNPGDYVELFGLSNAEYNGQRGHVLFDAKNGRFELKLLNGSIARIKEANIRKLDQANSPTFSDKMSVPDLFLPRSSSNLGSMGRGANTERDSVMRDSLWDGLLTPTNNSNEGKSNDKSSSSSYSSYSTSAPQQQQQQEDHWDLSRTKGITFANSLTHCFDVVSNQVGVGIKQSKGLASLLKTIVEIQREAQLKILALIEKEQRKGEEVMTGAKGLLSSLSRDLFINPKGKDGMDKFAGVYDKTMDFLRREAGQAIKDLDQLEANVCTPLVNHNMNNEGRLNSIGKTEKICRAEMQEASKAVKRTQEACNKLLDQVIQAKAKDPLAPKTIDPTAADKKMKLLAKVQHKITTGQLVSPKKLQKMAYTAAQDYEAAVNAANSRQTQFFSSDLPNLFHQLEGLERTRLEEVSKILIKHAEEKNLAIEPKRVGSAKLMKDTQELDTAADMNVFLRRWISFAGFPPPAVPFTYQLSCSPSDIAKGRFENASSYFGNTLENIMKMQQPAYPEEKVPHIVEACIRALGDLGGFKSEGIFRISIPKEELDGLLRRFDAGDMVFDPTNPNAPACLLKQWLRLLEEPIIPSSMYSQAITLGSENSAGASIMQFYNQLPPINQNVIHRIAWGLVHEIIKPENAEENRMSIRNLAIVFSPGFLRNPSDDPMEMLNSAKFETQFTVHLFEALLKTNTPK